MDGRESPPKPAGGGRNLTFAHRTSKCTANRREGKRPGRRRVTLASHGGVFSAVRTRTGRRRRYERHRLARKSSVHMFCSPAPRPTINGPYTRDSRPVSRLPPRIHQRIRPMTQPVMKAAAMDLPGWETTCSEIDVSTSHSSCLMPSIHVVTGCAASAAVSTALCAVSRSRSSTEIMFELIDFLGQEVVRRRISVQQPCPYVAKAAPKAAKPCPRGV